MNPPEQACWLLVVLFLATPALSQSPADSAAGTYVVHGRVLDGDGNPLKDIQVLVENWPGTPLTTSFPDGSFHLHFFVSRDQYHYNYQAHIQFRAGERGKVLKEHTVPIREFTVGEVYLGTVRLAGAPDQAHRSSPAAPERETKEPVRTSLDKEAMGMGNEMVAMKQELDSLRQVVREFPGLLDSVRSALDAVAQRPVERSYREYRIRPGDTLTEIAAADTVYDDAELWPLLFDANRRMIADPDLIYPGQVLLIPQRRGAETE